MKLCSTSIIESYSCSLLTQIKNKKLEKKKKKEGFFGFIRFSTRLDRLFPLICRYFLFSVLTIIFMMLDLSLRQKCRQFSGFCIGFVITWFLVDRYQNCHQEKNCFGLINHGTLMVLNDK